MHPHSAVGERKATATTAACLHRASQRIDDGEAEASQEDPNSDGENHHGIIGEGREAVDQRNKTGVGKGRDREVATLPEGIDGVEASNHQAGNNDGGEHCFNGNHADKDRAQQSLHIAQAHSVAVKPFPFVKPGGVNINGNHLAGGETEALGGDHRKQCCERHHTDATNLHGQEHDSVPKGRPVGCHVQGRKPRDTDSRYGSEHRISKVCGLTRRRGRWEHQQRGGDDRQNQERANSESGGLATEERLGPEENAWETAGRRG